MQQELQKEQKILKDFKGQIGLDYIIHNNAEPLKYEHMLHQNSLRVKLKNCIMQKWTAYKEKHKKPTLNDMIKTLMDEKKKKTGKAAMGNNEEEEEEEEKKKKRENRKKEERAKLEKEAASSYLKLDQFIDIMDGIKFYKKRLHQQQEVIDLLERKLQDNVINNDKQHTSNAINSVNESYA